MPPVAYFLGKVGLVAISSTVQVALLLLVARVFFGVQLPSTADRWAVFALVFALGVFGGTVLGIAYSSMATARTVGAVVIGPMLVLQFISGVYIAFDDVPQWLQQVASVFPLKWIAQGMRSVFYPDRARLGRDGRLLGDRPHRAGAAAPGPWAGSCCACSPSSGSSAAPREPSGATMSDVTATGASSREEFGAMWRRQQPYWHAVFAIVWAAAVVVTLLDDPGPARPRRRRSRCSGSSPLAYAVLGTRAMTHRDLRWAVAYQVVAWSALLGHPVGRPEHPGLAALLHALPPAVGDAADPLGGRGHGRRRHRVLARALGAARLLQPTSLTEILISGVISMGLSLSLGLFINRIVGEAESRAETIDELRATQARLAAAERDRGVHEERERISREIHDTLAQGFTSVVALSRAAQAALARGDTAAAGERLALIEQTASDNLDEARLIVAELTPGHLQSRTLGEALERLGAAVTSETGLRADVRVAGDPVPLGGSAEVVILRTAQEALSNVRRHASAARVDLTLAYDDPDEVVLTVHDDGLGFDPDGARSGFGLDGVQARAAEVGGAVEVLSEPGTGTTLRLVVPR